MGSTGNKGNVVCDLDGVVYRGSQAIPGAGNALHDIEASGHRLLFATNNSSRTVTEVVSAIAVCGYSPQPDQIVGSAEAAALLLSPSRPTTLPVGGPGISEALRRYDIPSTADPGSAEAVVMGLRFDLGYSDLRDASIAVGSGARLVATNMDRTFPTPEGLVPGAGALVAAVEAATGVTAEVAGKPHAPIRQLVTERIGPGPVWVVGDRAETDLAMAHAGGWIPVLVLGGVTEDPTVVPEAFTPEIVVSSLADLVPLL